MNEHDDKEIPAFMNGRLSHAYIAGGIYADLVAMAAVCAGDGDRPCYTCRHCEKASRGLHPDILQVNRFDKKREILVDQIRELSKDVIRVPGEASAKVYIVNEADTMNIAAQNALLRILEDPPGYAVFVLSTDNPKALLPTVRSRCIEIKARPAETFDAGSRGSVTYKDNKIDVNATGDADLADCYLMSIVNGNESLIRFMFRLEKLEKSEFAAFVVSAREKILLRLREAIIYGIETVPAADLERADAALSKADEYLNLSVNTGHISGMLCSIFLK